MIENRSCDCEKAENARSKKVIKDVTLDTLSVQHEVRLKTTTEPAR